MRKIVYSTLVLLALTGCATHQQSNEMAGAVIGGVIGKQIGGTGGAILGAGMGAAVGGQQPTQPQRPNVIVQRQVITADPRGYRYVTPDYSMCTHTNYYEREACQRGADARAARERALAEQKNQRIREAYRQGFGH